MSMDQQIKQIIEKAKKDREVIAVALFGSYARKEKYNDIDICIFLKPKKHSAYALAKKRLQYTPENEKYDVQIFQELPLYIKTAVFRDLSLIYCNDEDALYDLCFKTEQEYEHFKPIYENYLEAVMNG